jgi:isoquinoline 1-oxidoreductase subunit alpha
LCHSGSETGVIRVPEIWIAADADRSHPVHRAWIEIEVPQCGHCQSGQMMSAVALLKTNPNPDDEDFNRAMSGNICRCGTHPRIRRAVHRVAEMSGASAVK